MSLLGQGRLPLRTTWTRAINDLYKPIIPEATDVVSTAIKDYVLGRQTEMDLRYWDGTQWVYPTYFQKLVNRVDDRWPNPTKPDTLSDAVNEMATNRPWVEPPVGGDLVAGQALIATGNGLEVEQKLVQFEDVSMVRYVGEQPGDYLPSEMQACLDSLPSEANDLSSAVNPYIIKIRKMTILSNTYFPSNLVVPSVKGITIQGVGRYPGEKTPITFGKLSIYGTPIGNNTWGIKFTESLTVPLTSRFIRFRDIELRAYCTVESDWTSSEYNIIVVDRTSSNATAHQVILDNAEVTQNIRASLSAKTARNFYFTNSNALSAPVYLAMSITKESSLGVNATNQLMTFKAITTDGNVVFSAFSASDDTIKTLSVTVSILTPPTLLFDFTSYDGATNYQLTLNRIKFSFYFARETTAYFSPEITFFDFRRLSTNFGGNYLHLLMSNCSAYLEAGDTTTVYNFDKTTIVKLRSYYSTVRIVGMYVKNGGFGTFSGTPILLQTTNNPVILDSNVLDGSRIISSGVIQQQGSESKGQLTSNNIIRDEKQLFDATARIAGKQYLTQSPLPPAAPRPGDLWIETTEQY